MGGGPSAGGRSWLAKTPLRGIPAERMIRPMVEYGNGVGQGTGAAGGSGGGGGSMDAGVAIGQFVDNAAYTLSTMPPTQLALLVIIVIVGFVIFKRAF